MTRYGPKHGRDNIVIQAIMWLITLPVRIGGRRR